MISQIDEGFLDKVKETFLDDMFANESLLENKTFISKLNKEEFRWMFDTQGVRDKVDTWIKTGFR